MVGLRCARARRGLTMENLMSYIKGCLWFCWWPCVARPRVRVRACAGRLCHTTNYNFVFCVIPQTTILFFLIVLLALLCVALRCARARRGSTTENLMSSIKGCLWFCSQPCVARPRVRRTYECVRQTWLLYHSTNYNFVFCSLCCSRCFALRCVARGRAEDVPRRIS